MNIEITFSELAQCARRELGHRRKLYPRLVRSGKIDLAQAETELLMMEAIAEYFEGKTQPKLL